MTKYEGKRLYSILFIILAPLLVATYIQFIPQVRDVNAISELYAQDERCETIAVGVDNACYRTEPGQHLGWPFTKSVDPSDVAYDQNFHYWLFANVLIISFSTYAMVLVSIWLRHERNH